MSPILHEFRVFNQNEQTPEAETFHNIFSSEIPPCPTDITRGTHYTTMNVPVLMLLGTHFHFLRLSPFNIICPQPYNLNWVIDCLRSHGPGDHEMRYHRAAYFPNHNYNLNAVKINAESQAHDFAYYAFFERALPAAQVLFYRMQNNNDNFPPFQTTLTKSGTYGEAPRPDLIYHSDIHNFVIFECKTFRSSMFRQHNLFKSIIDWCAEDEHVFLDYNPDNLLQPWAQRQGGHPVPFGGSWKTRAQTILIQVIIQ